MNAVEMEELGRLYERWKKDHDDAAGDAVMMFVPELLGQMKALTAERDEAVTVLGAWASTFGTNQLTHALAKFDTAKKERDAALKQVADCKDFADTIDADLNLSSSDQAPGDRLRSQFVGLLQAYRECREELDKASAACADLHNTVTMLVGGLHTQALNSPSIQKAVDSSRSCDCGKGYHHDDEWKPVVEILYMLAHENPCHCFKPIELCNCSIEAAQEALAHAEKLTGKEK